MKLSVGTKSILFGVHQFIWHPLTVGIAWFSLYGVWPKWHEVVAIFCHDVGYWGCPDMDGAEGRRHPIRGADLTFKIVYRLRIAWLDLRRPNGFHWDKQDEAFDLAESARKLSLGHSRFYAKQAGIPVSKLFAADKASIYFDPRTFYLLRARLSGELWEFIANSGLPKDTTPRQWHSWYVRIVGELI